MVMALSLFYLGGTLTLVAGYENGAASMAQLGTQSSSSSSSSWTAKYQATCHTQPILSLDIHTSQGFFLTSGADAIIAKHPLPPPSTGPPRPDATSTFAELAKVINTKHSGQQSLRFRSDGRLFATAGWDCKVRVYSAKTLNEVAVLKWHQAGCYAVAFADVSPSARSSQTVHGDDKDNNDGGAETSEDHNSASGTASAEVAVVPKLVELTVRDKRIRQAKTAHWLAAGSKDGKVSLWDIF